jgi:hypothetical protein
MLAELARNPDLVAICTFAAIGLAASLSVTWPFLPTDEATALLAILF